MVATLGSPKTPSSCLPHGRAVEPLPKTPSSFLPSSHPPKACGLHDGDIGTHPVMPVLTQVFLEIPSSTLQHL